MKTLNYLFTLMSILSFTTVKAQQAFLQGHIDGLLKGDTIIASAYEIPGWNVKHSDTVIVKQNNTFRTSLDLEQTEYLSLMHIPKEGKPVPSSKMALSLLVGKGHQLMLTGNVEYFVVAEVKGGFYDNPLVQLENKLENEHDKRSIDIYRKIEEAQAAEQKDSVQFYAQQYNTTRRGERLIAINDSVANHLDDSEFSAFQFYRMNSFWNSTDGQKRFEKFTPEVKESHFGKKAEEMIQKKQRLEIGSIPPDFNVITNTGIERKLSSYKDKHLLIYYWGMCPGALQISPKLVEFYNTYNAQGLEVLSVTKEDILKSYPQLKATPETWEKYKDFANPPWDVVFETDAGNAKIADDYNFHVLPTVILISPEGKILFHGYNDYKGLENSFLDNFNQ